MQLWSFVGAAAVLSAVGAPLPATADALSRLHPKTGDVQLLACSINDEVGLISVRRFGVDTITVLEGPDITAASVVDGRMLLTSNRGMYVIDGGQLVVVADGATETGRCEDITNAVWSTLKATEK